MGIVNKIMIDRAKDHRGKSLENLGVFVQTNPIVLMMLQEPLSAIGFARSDQPVAPERRNQTFLDTLVEEMILFAGVTRLSQEQLPWLSNGEEIIVGLAPAKSPHTGMAVTHDQLTTIHPQLLAENGLSRNGCDEEQLYVSYSGDPQVKVFPLHLLTFVVLKRADGTYEIFDSLKMATKLKADHQADANSLDLSLLPIFRAVSKYNSYSKELLTTLFNLNVAPQIYKILEECWNDGLLKRKPTLEELQLTKDELLSFIAYGHDSNNEDNLSRGPRSNPTDHWHNLIPHFRRRVIRLVKNSHPGDSLALDRDKQEHYAQVLQRLNTLNLTTAKLHLRPRRSLSVWQQLKMADISGLQIAELLTQGGKIINDVRDSLKVRFPDNDITVSVTEIRTNPDEVQMKYGAVIKITTQGVDGHELVASLLPLMSKYEAIKSEAFAHYKTYISTNNPQPLREFLEKNGLGEIVDQVLAWRPTVPMMPEADRVRYWKKYLIRRILNEGLDVQYQPLINLIKTTDYGKYWSPVSKMAERKLKKRIKQEVERILARERKQNAQLVHINSDDLVDITYRKLIARKQSQKHGRWDEIRDLVEASIRGLGIRGSEANFSLPLGLVISVEEVNDQGNLTSIVKLSPTGNNSASVENTTGVNVMRA